MSERKQAEIKDFLKATDTKDTHQRVLTLNKRQQNRNVIKTAKNMIITKK